MAKKFRMSKEKQLIIYRIASIVLAAILIIVIGVMTYRKHINSKANQMYKDLAAQVNDVESKPTNDTADVIIDSETEYVEEFETEEYEEDEEENDPMQVNIPTKNINWDNLYSVNEDIYAWICIPETYIDYPILQNMTDDAYYLEHNLDGSLGRPGCLYTEVKNSKDFSNFNTIIYGHNMDDGTMFCTLHYYENEEFFLNNPYIYVYTPDGVLVYEVFAAYNGDANHIMNTNDFSTEDGRGAYLQKILSEASEKGFLRENIELSTESHLLTLSTCTDTDDQRFLVEAVLLDMNALQEAIADENQSEE